MICSKVVCGFLSLAVSLCAGCGDDADDLTSQLSATARTELQMQKSSCACWVTKLGQTGQYKSEGECVKDACFDAPCVASTSGCVLKELAADEAKGAEFIKCWDASLEKAKACYEACKDQNTVASCNAARINELSLCVEKLGGDIGMKVSDCLKGTK